MRKLKLQMDDLRIDSFDTADVPAGGGTVRGHISLAQGSCRTCEVTCNPSCDYSCDYTCDGFATYGGTHQLCVRC
ncbi:hypothetical protein [Longimicrobium sp.]|uniref:hypothetical protein n=1 Tax=Longimicrobium sp. TaxID=2029185 RepID=UPI002C9FC433|nr:hypothetical protein [Longimicrobium sp.]HSU15274.1 hypothetical protein [Longimicrobium sp.]